MRKAAFDPASCTNDFVWTEATGQVKTMYPWATNVDRSRENEDGLHETGG